MVISMDRWRGKVAVVTGASAGIGAAIAEQLVEEGLKVVGLARRIERLQELAKKLEGKKGKLYPFKTDVAVESDILTAFKWIKDNLGPVHILVNNAGICSANSLIDGDTEKWRNIFDVNVMGLCISTREAIKCMKKNNIDGHIIHINSVAGHRVPSFSGMSVYPASKHAVTALTETLRHEINQNKLKIKITSVSPGAVATEIFEVSGIQTDKEMKKVLESIPMLKSEDVSDAVVFALSTPAHVQLHEITIKPMGELF